MSIADELLNSQLVAFEVHTGVYKSKNARCAVVVKVSKQGFVFFLTLTDTCRIVLEKSPSDKFLRDYPVELYRYPVLRAVRKYAGYITKDNFGYTDEARKVINAILTRR